MDEEIKAGLFGLLVIFVLDLVVLALVVWGLTALADWVFGR
ncbi:hypothetical protein [Actinosynnema sp. NPDC020468]